MTPERAKEIAYQAWDAWMETDHDDHVSDALTKAILQACKEQREADAKICDAIGVNHHLTYKIEPGPNAYNPYFEGASDGADECGTAIRSAK